MKNVSIWLLGAILMQEVQSSGIDGYEISVAPEKNQAIIGDVPDMTEDELSDYLYYVVSLDHIRERAEYASNRLENTPLLVRNLMNGSGILEDSLGNALRTVSNISDVI